MKKKLLLLPGMALLLVIVAPIAVYAQDGSDEAVQTTTSVDVSDRREAAREKAQEKAKNKEARVAEIKQEVETRKASVKADVCEKKEAQLNRLMPRLTKGATNVKSVIDKMYDRVVGFYESGQLTVSNYDELVSAIELSKAESEAALDALEDYEIQVDCDTEDAGEQLDSYRTAVKEAKDSLKAYRKSVVELISSMKSASAQQDDENTEQTETESGENNEQEQ